MNVEVVDEVRVVDDRNRVSLNSLSNRGPYRGRVPLFYGPLRPIGATAARQIPVLKVTRSNRVSVTLSLVGGVTQRYTHRHGFHKVMKAVDEVVDDKIAYFARSCNYTYNLGY